MRRELRSVPIPVLIAGAILAVAVFLLSGAGPSLPGPPIREWLGIADERSDFAAPCKPDPREIRAPSKPKAGPGRWRREAPMPLAIEELSAAPVGHRVYLVGGHDRRGRSLSSVTTYDPIAKRYARAPDLPEPLDHPAAFSRRGRLYVLGGYSKGVPSNRFWRYSPATRKWARLAPMHVARGGHAVALVDDRLYSVGGSTEVVEVRRESSVPTLEVYDFGRDRWTSGPDMPTPRTHVRAAALDHQLYAIGGRRRGDFSMTTVERFDPARGVWKPAQPLSQGVNAAGVVVARGRIVVIGGGDPFEEWVTPASWSFDPADPRWRRLPDLRTQRQGHAAALLRNRIYVFAGSPCGSFGVSRSAESLSVR